MTAGQAGLARAAVVLASGGVVAVPTDTVYGLAADPHQKRAVASLFALKGRPESVALPVLIADPTDAAGLALVDDRARVLFERYWPGPLTVVLPRRRGNDLHLGGDPASVGLRCPSAALTRRLLAATGPLAVTSANRHGGSPARSADEVTGAFGRAVALVLDGGRCVGEPSTVVSLSGDLRRGDGRVDCLRAGAIAMTEIEQLLASL